MEKKTSNNSSDNNESAVFEDGKLRSASLDFMVQYLSEANPQDQEIIPAILVCHSTLVETKVFFLKFVEIYKGLSGNKEKQSTLLRNLYLWITLTPEIFVGDFLIETSDFIESLDNEYPKEILSINEKLEFIRGIEKNESTTVLTEALQTTSVTENAKQLEEENEKEKNNKTKKKRNRRKENQFEKPLLPRWVPLRKITLNDLKPLEIARQLTLLQQSIYLKIKRNELVTAKWAKSNLKHLSPNILKYISKYNLISHVFTSWILSSRKKKNRAKILDKCIQIMDICFKWGDFVTTSILKNSLSSKPILRLSNSWDLVSEKKIQTFQRTEEMFSHEKRFWKLRTIHDNTFGKCVPFPGLYLVDLTFITEGNPNDHLDNFNLHKIRLEYRVIESFVCFQTQGKYNFKTIPQIQKLLERTFEGDLEKIFYKSSIELEPQN
ncbi:guanine nucleotide exchange factor [Anaeramoeba flamelloides]|uniref:Guanine nucleotide exchange factor n=1 Tax=Anaeramoeba flamelloides TaxID=1746091 RepID=A0ABQ8YGY0_9EUKA|nr:guanine nucleotide exchange factor [Anaeramoeba flamelloides]